MVIYTIMFLANAKGSPLSDHSQYTHPTAEKISTEKVILIVEDNDLNLKLFRDLLGANGYKTVETKEGLEAISLAKNLHPDLILMDIQLPEISGLEVTRRIKADREVAGIPIIAVTAFAMKNDEEKILRAGCEAYISKPISITDFLSTVRYFLGELGADSAVVGSA
jgi:two-component system, cell cycle response regulator DivK